MTHQRNTEGLAKAAKERRQATIKRVNSALDRLLKDNKKINFNTVAKAANVGKPWLYKEKVIRDRIETLREQTRMNAQTEKSNQSHKASDQSKDHLIAMLKERVRKVEAENKELKQKIEVLYGQLCSKN